MQFQKNVLLKNHTTFKIGGRARYFFVAKTKEDLISAITRAKEKKLPFFILGGGSNILVSDRGYKGLVIKILDSGFQILDSKITASPGAVLGKLVGAAAGAGLTGLEWAAGIPGTAGGAVRGNAGAFDGEMKDIVLKVEFFDAKNQKIKTVKNQECQFGYRNSIFKKNPNLIILSCKLQLKKGDKKKIKEKINEYLDYRQERHPKEPSAGSIFKNVGSTPAALLIHRCGLTGKRIGGAQISKKHSNFIVNLGGAKAKDVLKLINLTKKKVKERFVTELEEEIQYLGSFPH